MSDDPKVSGAEGPDSVARSLRAARERRGLTTRELAARIGVSPAFITLIETGRKRPSAENARALAKVLGLPEEPLIAWVEMGGRYDRRMNATKLIGEYLRAMARHRPAADPPRAEPDSSQRLEGARHMLYSLSKATDRGEMPAATRLIGALGALGRNVQPAPLLAEGADPGRGGSPWDLAEDTVVIDRNLLPAQTADDLWAYRISDAGARHAPDTLAAGDVVVLTREVWPLIGGAVYAVWLEGRVELSRVSAKEESLVVLLAGEVELIRLPGPGVAPDELRGRVVLLVRPTKPG